MKSKGLVWCTSTFYENPTEGIEAIRFAEACKTVRNATGLGVPIYIVDESPQSSGVAGKLTELGAWVVTPKQPGMGPCRAQAVETAVCAGYIPFYTEPEKAALITDRNVGLMVHMLNDNSRHTGVVVPYRTSACMDSYPFFQAFSEVQGNRELDMLTGMALDWYIGPRLMNAECAEIFIEHHRRSPDPKWASLMTFLIEIQHTTAWTIDSVVCPDYLYSPDQRAVEADDAEIYGHRARQREVILAAMISECDGLEMESMAGYLRA